MGMFKKGKSIDHGVINSVIGRDATVKGEIMTKGAIRVDGEFEGRISAQGDIFLGEGSKIVGNLNGSRIVVSGEVNGNIVSSNGLEITRSGKVYGDVTGDKLVIDEGAIYKGKVTMEASSRKGSESPEGDAEPAKFYKTAKAG
jgi:cytoskeletal protein CcmA (bactofilin family)